MNKFVGKEALEEVVNKINDLETYVLKVENNNVSDAYTKEESDNKYLRKGNYATLADVQSNNIKVINLTGYQDKELPIKNAEPFFCKITDPRSSASIFDDLCTILASHYRWVLNVRIDCFLHDTFAINDDPSPGVGLLYSIIIGYPTGGTTKYKMYGFLHRNANKEWEFVKTDLRTVIDNIEGSSALEFAEMIVPLFGEDLPERMKNAEQKFTEIGNLSQINLPNDRDSLVDSINRLTKRTEVLMNRIEQLETELNYTPMIQEVVGKDPWTGELKNMDIEIQ